MIWVILIVGLIIIGSLGIRGYYRKWLKVQTKRVSADSKIIQTSRGQVEYDMRGHGPTVLHFLGGNVGAQWLVLSGASRRGGISAADTGSPRILGDAVSEQRIAGGT